MGMLLEHSYHFLHDSLVQLPPSAFERGLFERDGLDFKSLDSVAAAFALQEFEHFVQRSTLVLFVHAYERVFRIFVAVDTVDAHFLELMPVRTLTLLVEGFSAKSTVLRHSLLHFFPNSFV